MTADAPEFDRPGLRALWGYLRTTGWHQLDLDDRTSMWGRIDQRQLGTDPSAEIRIVLPANSRFADYNELVEKAIRALAHVERRDARQVKNDIAFGAADNVSVRLNPPTPSGEAPLADVHTAVAALRDYVVGAASSLDTRALVLPSRRPLRAEAYAMEARLSTGSGSFVLNLALPLGSPPEPSESDLESPLLDLPVLPYGRLIANRMAAVAISGTTLARAVAAGEADLGSFGEPRRGAANATELAALAAIGRQRDRQADYQLRFAQSPAASSGTREPIFVGVTETEQQVLADASDFLRTRQPREGVVVTGLVVRLAREANYGPGDVVVQGIDDDSGTSRRFRINLGEDDYVDAIRAHQNGLTVSARGDVRVRGNSRQLVNVSGFTAYEALPDE